MKYYVKNNIHIIECSVEEFRISIQDVKKKSTKDAKTFVNAGFFGVYRENGVKFTLPSGNLVADIDTTEKHINYYMKERGNIKNGKFYFDSYSWSYMNQFYKKPSTTFIIENNKPRIEDITKIKDSFDYAITGTPIIRNSADVKFKTYVKPMGWDGSSLYGTKRIMIGLKPNDSTIYIMGWKSTTSNCIYSGETWKKLKGFGFKDVIALDGGGSYHYVVNGKTVDTMSENRQINNVIIVNDLDNKTVSNKEINPYKAPLLTLTQGSKGNSVCWLQWQLKNKADINCSIDGSFGPATKKAVEEYQEKNNLEKDGKVGPLTRASLKKL